MITWDIYEITTKETVIHKIMFRGRIRKFALQKELDLLTENAADVENAVRFALISGTDPSDVEEFLKTLVDDVEVRLVAEGVPNPVLSKLKVNKEERYTI